MDSRPSLGESEEADFDDRREPVRQSGTGAKDGADLLVVKANKDNRQNHLNPKHINSSRNNN